MGLRWQTLHSSCFSLNLRRCCQYSTGSTPRGRQRAIIMICVRNQASFCSALMAKANLASQHALSSATSLHCSPCLPIYSGLVLPSSHPRRLMGSTGTGSAADKLGFATMTANAPLLCTCHFERPCCRCCTSGASYSSCSESGAFYSLLSQPLQTLCICGFTEIGTLHKHGHATIYNVHPPCVCARAPRAAHAHTHAHTHTHVMQHHVYASLSHWQDGTA